MTEPQEHLILNYLQGTLSPEERVTFEEWLNQSEGNRKLVSDFQGLWQLSDVNDKDIDFQKELEWIRLQASLNHEVGKAPGITLNTKSYVWKIAAAISFLLISSFVLFMTVLRSHGIVHETNVQQKHVVLPDGSEVWLNEKSRLAYQDDFSEARSLTLKGEGYFEVKPNPQKPFVIHVGEAKIKVLGTSFNVNGYTEEMQTEVFVVTGKVSFSTLDQSNSIILLPGSKGIFNKNNHTLISKTTDGLNQMAWKEKRLVFKKTALREVLKTLQSYFKTNIQVKNEKLLNCRFTGSFNNPTLPEVMETLSLALNLKIDHQANAYALDGEGCTNN